MSKKIFSNISKIKPQKTDRGFFDMPQSEREKIIKKAAELSAQDQKDLLRRYQKKFGHLQTNTNK